MNKKMILLSILMTSLFYGCGSMGSVAVKNVNSCTYKIVNTTFIYDLFDSDEEYENKFRLIKLAIYDIFPNMDGNTFLFDDELKVIQGKMIYNVHTDSFFGTKYEGRSNFKIINNKITFSNPEIFFLPSRYSSGGWEKIPNEGTISEKTACNTIDVWEKMVIKLLENIK